MTVKYVFQDNGWWDEAWGCDCCEPYYVESFNCISHLEIVWGQTDLWDCYVQSIYHHIGILEDYEAQHLSNYSEMDIEELKTKCEELGIVVKIVDDYGQEW